MDYSLDGLLLTSEGTVVVDNPKALTASSAGLDTGNKVTELYRKLLQMEQETELLREVNRALREENVLLQDKLKKWDTGHHESQCSSQTVSVTHASATVLPYQYCPRTQALQKVNLYPPEFFSSDKGN